MIEFDLRHMARNFQEVKGGYYGRAEFASSITVTVSKISNGKPRGVTHVLDTSTGKTLCNRSSAGMTYNKNVKRICLRCEAALQSERKHSVGKMCDPVYIGSDSAEVARELTIRCIGTKPVDVNASFVKPLSFNGLMIQTCLASTLSHATEAQRNVKRVIDAKAHQGLFIETLTKEALKNMTQGGLLMRASVFFPIVDCDGFIYDGFSYGTRQKDTELVKHLNATACVRGLENVTLGMTLFMDQFGCVIYSPSVQIDGFGEFTRFDLYTRTKSGKHGVYEVQLAFQNLKLTSEFIVSMTARFAAMMRSQAPNYRDN